jgi:hypothetical protein
VHSDFRHVGAIRILLSIRSHRQKRADLKGAFVPHRLRALALIVAVPLLLALPASVGAQTRDDPVLIASVGTSNAPDGFRITLTDANGQIVSRIPAGEYSIQVHDFSTIHNFHLTGPGGVNEFTPVESAAEATWTVTFVNGTYRYQCDAHPSTLSGTFAVGPPPPPPVRLTAKVAAGGAVSLLKAGARVASLPAGRYRIAVADTSAKENFHLLGPGVNARTTLTFKGSKIMLVTLKKGLYHYRSDAHLKLARALKVVAAVPPR